MASKTHWLKPSAPSAICCDGKHYSPGDEVPANARAGFPKGWFTSTKPGTKTEPKED